VQVLDAPGVYPCIVKIKFRFDLRQERGFLVHGIDHVHRHSGLCLLRPNSQHNAGQTTARPHIEHAPGTRIRG